MTTFQKWVCDMPLLNVCIYYNRQTQLFYKQSECHALWVFPVGLDKEGVPDKTSHNWTFGGPDSESYQQRPTWLPAEGCGFHPRSFEEAGGCRRCLHWILSYASIFIFSKVHVKIIFFIFTLEMYKLQRFVNAYLLPTNLYIHIRRCYSGLFLIALCEYTQGI